MGSLVMKLSWLLKAAAKFKTFYQNAGIAPILGCIFTLGTDFCRTLKARG
jgi:hypothetical protein